MSNEAEKKVILISSDGESFEVDEAVAVQSQALRHIIEDGCSDSAIPIANVTSFILAKVIEYCKKHTAAEDDLEAWDAKFVKVDLDTLFHLILAANYLDMKSLLELTCKTAANMIIGKSPEAVRKLFNIKNDYTPEEEEEVRRENAWAFQ